MKKIGLIIEGGGLRGLFATGVLDLFMDNSLEFPYINGVSYGSVNAFSYISKQRGRTKRIADRFVNDPRYMGWGNVLKEGNFFATEFGYKTIPEKLEFFDLETFKKSKTIFNMVVTNCETGKAEYLEKNTLSGDELMDGLRAGASLPFISKMVKIKGKLYLDGGMTDSIPLRKAVDDGYKKNVVILTRPRDYRKNPMKFKPLGRLFYRKYPEMVRAMENRFQVYNETLDYIDSEEKSGSILVIRPERDLQVGRLEKNLQKLHRVYIHGMEVGEKKLEEIGEFIS